MVRPLEGLTVVDLSWGLPGALVSMFLGDYGAEVFKIEPPGGDDLRSQPGFSMWQRGKKSVVLDLKRDEGREQARRLASTADVLVQNYRPGVAERLGLGYDDLAEANPGLVYATIPGMGPKVPSAPPQAHHADVAAATAAVEIGGPGGMSATAWENELHILLTGTAGLYGSAEGPGINSRPFRWQLFVVLWLSENLCQVVYQFLVLNEVIVISEAVQPL